MLKNSLIATAFFTFAIKVEATYEECANYVKDSGKSLDPKHVNEDGACFHYISSPWGWCGTTDAHKDGGIDCTGFGFEPNTDEEQCRNYVKDSGKSLDPKYVNSKGACFHYISSPWGWCGTTDAHINGGVDCTNFCFDPEQPCY